MQSFCEIFWASHDPAVEVYSRQYRNAVFYLNEGQQREAEASRQRLSAAAQDKILLALEPAGTFFVAEDYHQKYLLRKAAGIFQELQAIYPDTEEPGGIDGRGAYQWLPGLQR